MFFCIEFTYVRHNTPLLIVSHFVSEICGIEIDIVRCSGGGRISGGNMKGISVTFCLYLLALCSGFASTQALSATTTSTPTSTIKSSETMTEQGPKKFSAEIDLSMDSNLMVDEKNGNESNVNLLLSPKLRVSDNSSVTARIMVIKKLYADEITDFDDTTVSWAHDPIALGDAQDEIFLDYAATGYLPTNKENRERGSYQGGTGALVGIGHSFQLFGREAFLKYSLGLLKNYYEFERTADNSANLSHRVRHTLNYNQQLTKKLSFDAIARYQVGWTYQNALRTRFFISEELDWAIRPTTTVYLNHTNEGNALEANGTSSNIALYDEKHSVLGLGVRVTY